MKTHQQRACNVLVYSVYFGFDLFRKTDITEYDFKLLNANSITSVRLPIGWWTFAELPVPETAGLIADPCYPSKQFVTVPGPMLETLLATGAKYNVSFLIDMHAMPCGSSDGTYNGIFPSEVRALWARCWDGHQSATLCVLLCRIP